VTLERIGRAAWVTLSVFAVLHVAAYATGAWGVHHVVRIQDAIGPARAAIDAVVGAALLFQAGRALGPVVRGDADAAFGEGRTRLWWTARVSAGVGLGFMLVHAYDQRLRLGLRVSSGHVLVQELAARASTTAWGVAWVALALVAGAVASGVYLATGWMSRAHADAPLAGGRRRRIQRGCVALAVTIGTAGALGAVAIGAGLRFGAAQPASYESLAPCPAPSAAPAPTPSAAPAPAPSR
jgi:hypothetical protein